MKVFSLTFLMISFVLLAPSRFPAFAEEKATPQEVVQKVREAAEFLSDKGAEGVAEFSERNGRWVWKDTYVWVLNCSEMTDLAHPINPKLVGMDLAGFKDVKGNYLFIQLCETAKKPKGGWVEYWWPKVGEKTPSRKISYIFSVPRHPYQVAAGIYDDQVPLTQLDAMIK